MKLDAAQNKLIQSKVISCHLIKGASGTGKTTTSVYRTMYLKNNYCLYADDKILMVTPKSDRIEYVRNLYNEAKEKSRFDYATLFSDDKERVFFSALDEIIEEYYSEYVSKRKLNLRLIDRTQQEQIINECLDELRQEYAKQKILNSNYIKFFMDEISWIKSCGYSLEQYRSADRIGRKYKKGDGPNRLLKNSISREVIYKLVCLYNHRLKESSLVDFEDKSLMALEEARKNLSHSYSHIIIDDCDNLTKIHLELVMELNKKKTYSSIMLIANNASQSGNGWIIKGRKINALELNTQIKSSSLRKVYTVPVRVEESIKGGDDKLLSSVENFEYHDLKHYRKYKFLRDYGISEELIVSNEGGEDIYKGDELRQIPVYSDIAAGEPIYINDEIESNFSIPQYWLKGMKDCFILKVKGDSMIGANINDGDYVVIRKQYTAQNNDIVAVDLEGNATLKRLSLKKGGAVLLPENENYEPIPLRDREASVIGIAVGIIKNKM
ncbi:MAG: transcriptional repressor LexA [Bacillota bacterium]|nr:transcriptional repressor LexA [Bacillota bacterium]